jgi:hypothetical protein
MFRGGRIAEMAAFQSLLRIISKLGISPAFTMRRALQGWRLAEANQTINLWRLF